MSEIWADEKCMFCERLAAVMWREWSLDEWFLCAGHSPKWIQKVLKFSQLKHDLLYVESATEGSCYLIVR